MNMIKLIVITYIDPDELQISGFFLNKELIGVTRKRHSMRSLEPKKKA